MLKGLEFVIDHPKYMIIILIILSFRYFYFKLLKGMDEGFSKAMYE